MPCAVEYESQLLHTLYCMLQINGITITSGSVILYCMYQIYGTKSWFDTARLRGARSLSANHPIMYVEELYSLEEIWCWGRGSITYAHTVDWTWLQHHDKPHKLMWNKTFTSHPVGQCLISITCRWALHILGFMTENQIPPSCAWYNYNICIIMLEVLADYQTVSLSNTPVSCLWTNRFLS